MNGIKQKRASAFAFVLSLAFAFVVFAGCQGKSGGGGGGEPEAAPVPMGKIEVRWPYPTVQTNGSSRYLLPAPSTNVSHFRVVAFLTGTTNAPPVGAGVTPRADVSSGVTVADLVVPAGATYDVCSLIIANPAMVGAFPPTSLGGACSTPVVVTAGQTSTANIDHVLDAMSVAAVSPPSPSYAYGETATVAFVSTGLPANIASAAIYRVDPNYPAPSSTVPIGCANVVTGTPCVTSVLGIPGATSPTPFKFLAEVNAIPYARDHGLEAGGASTGLTLWPSGSIETNGTALRVVSVDTYTVDSSATGDINVNLQ